jgi:hypothetical protein
MLYINNYITPTIAEIGNIKGVIFLPSITNSDEVNNLLSNINKIYRDGLYYCIINNNEYLITNNKLNPLFLNFDTLLQNKKFIENKDHIIKTSLSYEKISKVVNKFLQENIHDPEYLIEGIWNIYFKDYIMIDKSNEIINVIDTNIKITWGDYFNDRVIVLSNTIYNHTIVKINQDDYVNIKARVLNNITDYHRIQKEYKSILEKYIKREELYDRLNLLGLYENIISDNYIIFDNYINKYLEDENLIRSLCEFL